MASTSTSTATTSNKRKRVVLTLEKKLEIVKKLKSGHSINSLAAEYNIGKTTVRDIRNSEKNLLGYASKLESSDGSEKERKVMKQAEDDKLDEAMYKWFIQKRNKNYPLSGPIIHAKAIEMNKMLNGRSDFKASAGWLRNFLHRHGIHQLSVQGEALSADMEAVSPFIKNFNKVLDKIKLEPSQLYNADETGLYWKALPENTFAAKSEIHARGHKIRKERITVLVCANASGSHRLPLTVIGKAKNPRALKNISPSALPVKYFSQKNAWMDSEIFGKWFHEIFVPEVCKHMDELNLPHRAILLIDNAPSHPNIDLLKGENGNICCLFLPPNTTSLIQPMDQSVIVTLKKNYRRQLLQKLIFKDEESESGLVQFWKNLNIKDAIYMLVEAWQDVKTENLRNSWNKLKMEFKTIENCIGETNMAVDGSELDINDDVTEMTKALGQLPGNNVNENDVVQWLAADANDAGWYEQSDQEIVESITNTELSSEEEEEIDESPKISNSDALESANKLIAWYEQQPQSTSMHLLILQKIRNMAAAKRYSNLKQKKIFDFFN